PTGRVFSRAELLRLAELAERHNLLVVSDEIYADLTHMPHRHIPFASLGPEIARRTITVTSATKAFNLAGLRCAVGHVGPSRLRAALDNQPT
ncbi:aminotransferase class I/II-fold pyridoxal phosphate-dependent enzyme, partial [Streptomyces sp. URMC 126]